MKQQTLVEPFEFKGKGLHTGLIVQATFCPAPVNTGLCLKRVDLAESPCFEALVKYVSATERGTVLSNGEWGASTVEHALSALYAMGITNCIIELNGPEMPILDGSAQPYVEAIQRVGIQEQDAEAPTFVVDEVIEFKASTGSTYRIEPCEREEVNVSISFPGNILHDQSAELRNMDNYALSIASARTFCFVREIGYMLSRGLIKGGDLSNAIVIYELPISQDAMDALTDALGQPRQDADKLGYLSPLKYPNEPARHKLLDVIGDFALLGMRLQGRITAIRPGHKANSECLKYITEKYNINK